MRFLSLILLTFAVVSCGKGGSGGSGSAIPEGMQCEVDGQAVSCDSIYDGLGVDILTAKIEAPASVGDSAISFTQSRSDVKEGRRINCGISVNAGDVYRYSVSGDTLYLDTPTANMQMKRVYGSGIVGKWKWSGIVDGATFKTFILTVTKSQKVFLQTTCER